MVGRPGFVPPSEFRFAIIEQAEIPGSSLTEPDLLRLDERICHLSPRATLCIEISRLDDVSALVNWLSAQVRYGHSGWENFLVSSTDAGNLARAQAIQPELRTGLIIDPRSEAANPDSLLAALRLLKADCVLPSSDALAEALLARASLPALKVLVRIDHSGAEAISAREQGADGVVTRQPNEVATAVASGYG